MSQDTEETTPPPAAPATPEKPYLTWILAAVALVLVAWYLHSGLETPDITGPQSTSDPVVMTAEITRLDNVYSEIIDLKSDFRDLWSLVAVVLAAVVAGAVLLRAPQTIIVALGVLLSVIYGSMEIKNPQKSVSAISKARNALSCTGHSVSQLVSAQGHEQEAQELAAALVDKHIPLIDYQTDLTIQADRLSFLLATQNQQREEAASRIGESLLIPGPLMNDELEQVEQLAARISDLVLSAGNRQLDPALQSALDALKAQHEKLIDAADRLQQPDVLRNQFEQSLWQYDAALSSAISMQKLAGNHVVKLNTILTELEPTTVALKQWPVQLSAMTQQAGRAIHQIHSNLLTNIAESGITIAELKALVESSGTLPVPPDSAVADSDPVDEVYVDELQNQVPQVVALADQGTLKLQIEILGRQAETLLNGLRSKLSQADAVTQKLKDAEPSVALLNQATTSLTNSGDRLNSILASQEYILTDAKDKFDQAHAIVQQIDFDLMTSELDACIDMAPVNAEA